MKIRCGDWQFGDLYFRELTEACPEQFEVEDESDGGRQVAYVRLRHGRLTVECPDVGGERIFEKHGVRDGESFADDNRADYLAAIARLVNARRGRC